MVTKSGTGSVTINGSTYILKGPLVEGLVEEFVDPERQTALQRISDRRGKSSWVVERFTGVGTSYVPDVPSETKMASGLVNTVTDYPTHAEASTELGVVSWGRGYGYD